MSAGRAKRGGEIGRNGEFYAGGTFLPSTRLPKMAARKRTAGGKVEIDRFVWAGRRDGYRAIYPRISAWFTPDTCRGQGGEYRIWAEVVLSSGQDVARLEELCSAFNRGERWTQEVSDD